MIKIHSVVYSLIVLRNQFSLCCIQEPGENCSLSVLSSNPSSFYLIVRITSPVMKLDAKSYSKLIPKFCRISSQWSSVEVTWKWFCQFSSWPSPNRRLHRIQGSFWTSFRLLTISRLSVAWLLPLARDMLWPQQLAFMISPTFSCKPEKAYGAAMALQSSHREDVSHKFRSWTIFS